MSDTFKRFEDEKRNITGVVMQENSGKWSVTIIDKANGGKVTSWYVKDFTEGMKLLDKEMFNRRKVNDSG